MEYLLKSSAILIIFYTCYKLFMDRETFFVGNRWFLLIGLLISIIIPFIVIPIYVEVSPIIIENHINTDLILEKSSLEKSIGITQLLLLLYACGVVFFLGKLAMEFFSLAKLLKKYASFKKHSYNYVVTDSELAPFSFFKWIVYNPTQFNDKELALILNHEKVHASQWHSIDIIAVQIACVLLWFNPFVWWYKKALQQNLEFIADQEAQFVAPCEKTYQSLLLKASIPSHQLALANNFYNSQIKKRIVMLQKSKSNRVNQWKYSLVIPLLVVFVFNFNTEVIAQTKNPEPEKVIIGQNVLKFVITKDTKERQLESIKQKMSEQKAIIEFRKLERNDRHEITGIKIDYEHNGKKGNFFINSENPINDIVISLNLSENVLSVGQTNNKLSQSFEIIEEEGKTILKKQGSGNNVFVYSKDEDNEDNEKIMEVGKDGDKHEVKKERKIYVIKSDSAKDGDETEEVIFIKKNKKDTVWIKKDVKNIVWTDDDGNDVEIITVEKENNKNIQIFNSGEEQPLILVDGKEISKKDMDGLEPKNIKNINVLKGEMAIKKHGQKSRNGVIEIITKKN